MIGKTLAHYQITGLLGKGGMGEVYRARDTKLDRDVALKVLPESMASHPERLARFTREAKTVAGLNHPNIVTLHSIDEADGIHFITMELVTGKPLTDLLPADGLPLKQVLGIAIPIADAMAAAHARGIVHRDLKPGNIMVTDADKRVKVLDFGLAKLAMPDGSNSESEHLDTMIATSSGSVVGTPYYMSPEQSRGLPADHRADVFSLGVILFEMATGMRPFRGASAADILSSVLRDEPPSLAEQRPDLPPALERIIRRCLEKDPEDRYRSAKNLLDHLSELKNEMTSGISRSSLVGLAAASDSSSRRGVAGAPAAGSGRRRIALLAAVVVLAVAAVYLGRSFPFGGGTVQEASASPVVAVLPFENLGGEEDEYLAAGITDEITARLGLIQELGVISRTSARVYANSHKTVREIGHELNANFVLEGAIQWDKSGEHERVRITPSLIRVEDDTRMWSGSFDREVTEIFDMQAELAARIAEALDVTILSREQQALSDRPTGNIAAYQAFLQGMKQLQAPAITLESSNLGIQMFRRAVDLDPGFARAYAGLSMIHSRAYNAGLDRGEQRLVRAREAADRALALDPGLAEAHLALGYYHYWGPREYDRALAAFDEARKLAPRNSEIWLATAYVKRRQGDLEGAAEMLERTRPVSPMDPNVEVALGETYGMLRRWAEAERALRRAIALAPEDPYSYSELALVYLRWSGDTEAARSALAAMPPAAGAYGCRVGYLVELLARDYAAALDELDACPQDTIVAGAYFIPTDLARGEVLRLTNESARARAAFESARGILEHKLAENAADYRVYSALGLAYAGLGRTEEAVRSGRRAVELYPLSRDALEAPVQLINLARIMATVGATEEALAELDRALSIPSLLSTAWLQSDPRWDVLRGDPGFEALLRKHGEAGAE